MAIRFFYTQLLLLLISSFANVSFSQSTDFEEFLRNGKSSYTNDNVDMVKNYLPNNWIAKDDKYASYSFSTYRYFKLNGFYFVPVMIGHMGVCADTHLVSYDKEGKIIDDLLVESGCDRPGDIATDDYTEYQIIADTIIEVKDIHLEPIDKEKMHSASYDWMEEDEEDTTLSINYYTIRDGLFYQILKGDYNKKHYEDFSTSEIILKKSKLQNFTKHDLSIARNEIFARKGYIFKTEKWREYFSKKKWYDPRYEDVVDLLTAIEKINIQLLLKLENNLEDRGERPIVAVDGFFIDRSEQFVTEFLGKELVQSREYIEPTIATKIVGDIGKYGLILIKSNNKRHSKILKLVSEDYLLFNDNPQIIIDGKEVKNVSLESIDPDTIESIEIISPLEAMQKFSTTKKGGIILINLID